MPDIMNSNVSASGLVEKYIGTAYDTVKIVADNIDAVTSIGEITDIENLEEYAIEISESADRAEVASNNALVSETLAQAWATSPILVESLDFSAKYYANQCSDIRADITELDANAITLIAGSAATAGYDDATGVLTIGVPVGANGDDFNVNAQGALVDRTQYNNQAIGFSYLALDQVPNIIYFKLTNNNANEWSSGSPVSVGATGVGVESVVLTGQSGLENIYTMTFTDTSVMTYSVFDGIDGSDVMAQTTPPDTPEANDLWVDINTSKIYMWYENTTGSPNNQWININ